MTQNDMREGVSYRRVSTPSQGESRNGLEAQDIFVEAVTREYNIRVIAKFHEVESGENNKRAVINKVLRFCRKHKKMLVIPEVDRLSRDVLFVAKLFISGVEVFAADKPEATILDLMEDACKAQREREKISKRTKAGLQAKLRRGEVMGENAKVMAMENRYLSEKHARRIKPIIELGRAEGFSSVRKLMVFLNDRKVRTLRRKRWKPFTVHSVLLNIKALKDFMNQDSYKILFKYISGFTQNDDETQRLMDQHYEAIVAEVVNSKNDFIADFTRMLCVAREIALKAANDNKPGKCWTERTSFFPLSEAMTENHKEVFCLRFYHGLSEEEVSDRLKLTPKQIHILLKQALQDISQQSIVKVPEILSF